MFLVAQVRSLMDGLVVYENLIRIGRFFHQERLIGHSKSKSPSTIVIRTSDMSGDNFTFDNVNDECFCYGRETENRLKVNRNFADPCRHLTAK